MDFKDIHDHALRGFLLRIERADAGVLARLNKSELIDAAQRTGYTAESIAANEVTHADYWRTDSSKGSVTAPLTANQTEIIAQSILERSVRPLETKIDDLRLNSNSAIIDINNNLSNVNDNIKDVNSRLDSAVSKLSADIRAAVPTVDASAAVADAVAKAFAPFKAIVDSVAGAPEALAEATAVRIIDRRPAVDVFGIDIRNADGSPRLVDIFNDSEAPTPDDSYIWPEDALRYALVIQDASAAAASPIPPNLWLAGDRGTGKTQFAQQFAARTGRGFVRINFDRHLERLDFIGSKGLVDGNTVWQDGSFLLAFKRTGCVILLDEFGFANPANVANLQALLEPNAAVTFDGFSHRRASGVLVFAADNSTGNRDDSGRFKGVQEQNAALLDRFPFTVTFKFLPPAVEAGLIQKRTGCSKSLADSIVRVLSVARKETESGEIIDAPSLRQAFALATAINAGIDPQNAWVNAIANKSPAESRAALDSIALTFFSSIQ